MPSGTSRNLLKNFRRKSSGNALDLQGAQNDESTPTQSTFRVLERPDKADPGHRASVFLPGKALAHTMHAKSMDNLAMYNNNRGSGGTTHSGSSGYYDNSGSSARHSSTSTLPSSLDDPENSEIFFVKKSSTLPQSATTQNLTPLAPPTPSFSARAGRALSFGLRANRQSAIFTSPSNGPISPPPPPPERPRSESFGRDRTMTTSTYASTAKPPQLVSRISASDFGNQFENMFEGMSKRKEPSPSPSPVRSLRDLPPIDTRQNPPTTVTDDTYFPPGQTYRPSPSPSPVYPTSLHQTDRRYSWDSKKSSEQLMSTESSGLNSPAELYPTKNLEAGGFTSFAAIRGYEPIDRNASPERQDPRDSPTSYTGNVGSRSTGNKYLSPSHASSRDKLHDDYQKYGLRKVVAGNTSRDRLSPAGSESNVASPERPVSESNEETPRARLSYIDPDDIPLFSGSPTGPSPSAIRPVKPRVDNATTPKRMTRAQFEQATRMPSPNIADDKSEDSENDDIEDEDEGEKQKKIAAQRRRQEATMSVYRQQMKKVTGGSHSMSDLPGQIYRPGMDRSASSMSIGQHGVPLASPGMQAEEEDEDVPLGVLQAHGFPSKTRPPSHLPGTQSGYAASANGDTVAGTLPAFARKLPHDPYYGASLVNPVDRESLAFASGASVYGAPASPLGGGPPGGLVGVIANEERAKASRRGSSNQVTGGYGPIPLPNSMQGGMPSYSRSPSTASLLSPPQMGSFFPQSPGAPGMAGMAPDQASLSTQQQMAQLMQMQTQIMQQMMAMQAGQPVNMNFMQGMQGLQGMPPMINASSTHLSPTFVPQPRAPSVVGSRPPSIADRGRAHSMLQPPSSWANDALNLPRPSTTGSGQRMSSYAGSMYGANPSGSGAYSPSIAPSERSNIGMPSRYRPVSIIDGTTGNAGRSKTMTSTAYQPSPLSPLERAPSPAKPVEHGVKPQKSTIRLIDRLKGSPKVNFSKPNDRSNEDEDDEAAWAQLAKKKESMRMKRAHKKQSQTQLAELYQGLGH